MSESYNSILERMNNRENKKLLYSLAGFVVVFVAVVATSFMLLNQQQDLRQRASEKTFTQEAAPDEILLRFKPGANKNAQDKILKENGLSEKEEIAQIKVKVLKVAPEARDAVIQALSHNPTVDFAETNILSKPEFTPDDPNFIYQWYLPRISAPTAWDNGNANNVLIAVCDTGVNQVPDLLLRTDLGWNAADGSNNFTDNYGHGTKVSGTAAAVTNNGIGVASPALGAKILPVRISNLTDGGAYTSDAAKCVNYAADHGAKVINISYDMGGAETIDAAGQYAQTKGALTTVAAGNDSTNFDWPSLPGFIAVSATNSQDILTNFSNFGNFVDIAAPGISIWTTYADGTYSSVSGTSFASPITAGVIALIFGSNPSLSPLQAQNVLFSSATDIGNAGWDNQYGSGMVNAANAVAKAKGITINIDKTPPTSSITAPLHGSTVSGGIVVKATATDDVGISRVTFLVDSVLISTTNISPYEFYWDTTSVPDGIHNLGIYAYDYAGNLGQSYSTQVTVSNGAVSPSPTNTQLPTNTPTPSVSPTPIIPTATKIPTPTLSSSDSVSPIVSITSPLAGSTVAVRSTLNIQATASDNIGVVRTEFYINNTLTCSDTTSPYSCSWKVPGAKNKSYTISAKAYDGAGNNSQATISVVAK